MWAGHTEYDPVSGMLRSANKTEARSDAVCPGHPVTYSIGINTIGPQPEKPQTQTKKKREGWLGGWL
jgi:hypothetical protein